MQTPQRVLLVSGDAILRSSLAEQIGLGGAYLPVQAATADEARSRAGDTRFEFVLIDAPSSEENGYGLCKNLRESGFAAPIILLTGPAKENWEAYGADAAVTKPFRFAALMSRVHALLRERQADEDIATRIGRYVFHPNAKTLTDGDQRIHLTEKEADILNFLKRAGATVSRETLLHEVWGYNPEITTHTLETHIYRLRQKIETGEDGAEILVTDAGGYRLTG